MSAASVSMVMTRSLTPAEKAKFDLVGHAISEALTAAGLHARVCEGIGDGADRMIGFIAGFFGPPVVAFPAARFLAASEAELVRDVQARA